MSRPQRSDHRRHDLFDRARQVSVMDVDGVAGLRRSGAGRMAGPCPLCGGSARSGRFTVHLSRNVWACFACPPPPGKRVAGGGPVDLEMALRGGSPRDAAQRLVGDLEAQAIPRAPARNSVHRLPPAPRSRSTFPIAAMIWRDARPARNSLVERWLKSRDLDPAALPGGLDALRYHPACPALWAGGQVRLIAPAMVVGMAKMVALGHGQIAWRLAAIHVTYLAADGADKADLRDPDTGDPLPSRRIYGHPIGAVAPLGPPALLSDARMGPLLVGEGLESTWAVAQMLMEQHGPMRVAAVLSLANFQGGWLRDRDGCFDPHAPISDPASPPWLLPDPGDVIVAIDADMAPVRIFARGPMRRRTETMLDAGGRAALCASLARQAWRRVGARSVRVVRPRMGADFNDQIREKA